MNEKIVGWVCILESVFLVFFMLRLVIMERLLVF